MGKAILAGNEIVLENGEIVLDFSDEASLVLS